MSKHRGNLYIDKHGILRMVMAEYKKNIVRGIDISNMTIDGIIVTEKLESIFSGHGNFDSKRNKVIWSKN